MRMRSSEIWRRRGKCSKNGEADVALEMFATMQRSGESVADAKAFVAAVMACSSLAAQEEFGRVDGKMVKIRALEKGMEIHSQAARQGFDSRDVFLGSSLVDLYSKCGSLVDARRAFERMNSRDVVSCTAFVLACIDNGEARTGLDMFHRMRLEGYVPDAQAFVAGLKACTCLAALQAGRSLHEQISEGGFHRNELVLSSLVDFYCKCGRMIEARRVFDLFGSKTRDTVVWTTMIAGYSRQGSTDKALELFNVMQDRGLHPDAITFTFVLAACSHAGLVDKGKEYFELMTSKFGISPDVEHFHGMIDLLGRANRVEEAVAVARAMPYKPTTVTWMTVLAACEKWKNFTMGREAFESVLALDEQQCSAYVSMANIYGSLGMVEEESRVLAMMVEDREGVDLRQ